MARGVDKKRPHHRGTKSGTRLPRMKQATADRTAVLEQHVAAFAGVVRNKVKARPSEQRMIELVSKFVNQKSAWLPGAALHALDRNDDSPRSLASAPLASTPWGMGRTTHDE